MRDLLLWPWQAHARLLIGDYAVSFELLNERRGPAAARVWRHEVIAGDTASALQSVLRDAGAPFESAVGVHVVLATSQVRLFVVTPPAGAKRLMDVQAAAALRFETLFGTSSDGYRIDADWCRDRPFLAAAMLEPALAELLATLAAARLRLLAVVPELVDVLNRNGVRRAVARDGWIVVGGAGPAHLLVVQAGAPRAYRDCAPASHMLADPALAEAWIAREALVLGVDRPSTVVWVDPALPEPHTVGRWHVEATSIVAKVARGGGR